MTKSRTLNTILFVFETMCAQDTKSNRYRRCRRREWSPIQGGELPFLQGLQPACMPSARTDKHMSMETCTSLFLFLLQKCQHTIYGVFYLAFIMEQHTLGIANIIRSC